MQKKLISQLLEDCQRYTDTLDTLVEEECDHIEEHPVEPTAADSPTPCRPASSEGTTNTTKRRRKMEVGVGEWNESRLTQLMENVVTRTLTAAAVEHQQAQEQLVLKMESSVNERMDGLVKRIEDGVMEKVNGRLETMEAKLTNMDQKWEAKFSKMQADMETRSLASLGSAGTTTAQSMDRPDFVARFISVKNILTGNEFDNPSMYGMTWEDADGLLNFVFQKLPPDIIQNVDKEATWRNIGSKEHPRRVIYTRLDITLRSVSSRSQVFIVSDAIGAILKNNKCCHWRGRELYAAAEPAPHRKPILARGGRALGILNAAGIPRGELKPEFFSTISILAQKPNERPALLVRYRNNTWTVFNDALMRLYNIDGSEIKRLLDALE